MSIHVVISDNDNTELLTKTKSILNKTIYSHNYSNRFSTYTLGTYCSFK